MKVSIRSIAKLSGFSKATVANALNGSPTVAAETARQILAAAQSVGYRRNPIVGTMMSALRRSQGSAFKGVIATVDLTEPDRPAHGPFHGELIKGCRERAETLGFKLETHVVNRNRGAYRRLDTILKTRGIHGIVMLPAWRQPDFSEFDWSACAGVYTDYSADRLVLHSVCCDHYRSMIELLAQLKMRRYRRPGLILEAGRDERVHLRMSAAFRAFQESQPDEIEAVSPFSASEITTKAFSEWFKNTRPDVVLSHDSNVLGMLEKLGSRTARETGFVCLNLAKATTPCTSLDLQPRQIGQCAIELLVGQIQRDAWGLPEYPTTAMIAARLIEGPTLRMK